MSECVLKKAVLKEFMSSANLSELRLLLFLIGRRALRGFWSRKCFLTSMAHGCCENRLRNAKLRAILFIKSLMGGRFRPALR